MSQVAGLASLAVAVIVPLWMARAILGAILALLLKHRTRSKHSAAASSPAT